MTRSVPVALLLLGGCPGVYLGSDETESTTEAGEGVDDEGVPPCILGAEGCACVEGACLSGLACESNLCVDVGEATSDSSDTGDTTGEGDLDTSEPEPGQQPGSGEMYAPCTQDLQCQPGLGCFKLFDREGDAIDGFCTIGDCEGVGANCDPSPGNTTSPVCIAVQPYPMKYCALECFDGPCPAGMDCLVYPGVSMCF